MAVPLPAFLPAHIVLIQQSLAVLKEYLPSPAPMLDVIDQNIPVPFKQLIAESPLNHLFANALADGEFDDFEGRRVRLEITGGQPGITIGFWAGRLRIIDGPGEATIRGSLTAFKTLAERRRDPDQLFFQRHLVIEGDTELGLGLKNLLDSLEWSFNWHGQVRAVAEQDRTADSFSNGMENATPGYATVDVELGWNFGATSKLSNLEVAVEGNNLLDKRYREHLTDGNILSPGRGMVAKITGRF